MCSFLLFLPFSLLLFVPSWFWEKKEEKQSETKWNIRLHTSHFTQTISLQKELDGLLFEFSKEKKEKEHDKSDEKEK